MAQVVFYEKPGCMTNARQKARLAAAGHAVEARSLLAHPWTSDVLREFFGDTPVAAWFNPASPRVKSGEVDPAACGGDDALALMLADPLLIRRPLIEANNARCAGFDREPVLSLLGGADVSDIQGCSHARAGTIEAACPAPAVIGSAR